jgi:hypothetical protein
LGIAFGPRINSLRTKIFEPFPWSLVQPVKFLVGRVLEAEKSTIKIFKEVAR